MQDFGRFQIREMRARGMTFLKAPDTYYEQLRDKLKSSKVISIVDFNVARSEIQNGCFGLIQEIDEYLRMKQDLFRVGICTLLE